jgi:hypothetical protein
MGMAFCERCGAPIEWMTATRLASVALVQPQRIRQLIKAGRFPGAVKVKPAGAANAFWRIPIAEAEAYLEARQT